MPRHVLKLSDLAPDELREILQLARRIKENPAQYESAAHRRGLLLLFEKTSTRTALSYQSAIARLGGYSVVLEWHKTNYAITSVEYETQYVSRNCDVIMARVKSNRTLKTMADNSQVPVINGCDDQHHPSQALADFLTIAEVNGKLEGSTLCYVGVHNNVANSLIEGCAALGVRLLLVTPMANEQAVAAGVEPRVADSGLIEHRDSLAEAAAEADFVYTDTWVDMEFFSDPAFEEEKRRRVELMQPFQLNRENLGGAQPWIMHDMPIHAGYEISADLVDSERSIIYQQAENRMWAQAALLLHLLGGKS